MAVLQPDTRRDLRHRLRTDYAFIEFDALDGSGTPVSAPLVHISAAGLSFDLHEPLEGIFRDAVIDDVTLRIGNCVLAGGITVRNVREVDGVWSCGATFCPETPEVEDRLMILITGIEAVEPPAGSAS